MKVAVIYISGNIAYLKDNYEPEYILDMCFYDKYSMQSSLEYLINTASARGYKVRWIFNGVYWENIK